MKSLVNFAEMLVSHMCVDMDGGETMAEDVKKKAGTGQFLLKYYYPI